jgi:hypothetical protein
MARDRGPIGSRCGKLKLVKLELAQSLYFRELDRRVQLDGAPTIRVGALGLIAGIFSFYIDRYTPNGLFLPWMFLFCLAGTLVCSVLAAIWIIRSYAGYTWQYIATPDKLLAFYRDIQARADRGALQGAEPVAVFEEGMTKKLIMSAAHNARNNNARSELLYYSSIFIAWAVLFTFIAGIAVLFEAFAQWPPLFR